MQFAWLTITSASAMSSADKGWGKFALCLHISKFAPALVHRAKPATEMKRSGIEVAHCGPEEEIPISQASREAAARQDQAAPIGPRPHPAKHQPVRSKPRPPGCGPILRSISSSDPSRAHRAAAPYREAICWEAPIPLYFSHKNIHDPFTR